VGPAVKLVSSALDNGVHEGARGLNLRSVGRGRHLDFRKCSIVEIPSGVPSSVGGDDTVEVIGILARRTVCTKTGLLAHRRPANIITAGDIDSGRLTQDDPDVP